MKLRIFHRHAWRSLLLTAALVAVGVSFGNVASADDDATEPSGGWDLSVTPVQSATIGAVALTGLFTLSLLQRRRRG
ncbi:hypothetical protein LZC95_14185 [Pendulispora brunnea]|uniref:Uncharacterized protein n=1 Tax=Pendulispora brunnea TaxID=2905690 RepID=A0ABZ2KH30_9BACT